MRFKIEKIDWTNTGTHLCDVVFDYKARDWKIWITSHQCVDVSFPTAKVAKDYASQVLFVDNISGWRHIAPFNFYRVKDTPIWLEGHPDCWRIEGHDNLDWFKNWLEDHNNLLYPNGYGAKSRRVLLHNFLNTYDKHPHKNIYGFMQKFY